MQYAELHCHSCLSLLDGAAEPEALIERAKAIELHSIALTDHDDLGGAVRFAERARELGVEAIIGAEITVAIPQADSDEPFITHLPLLAETREGYGNISTLITIARRDCPRGSPRVTLDQLAAHTQGVFALTGCPRGWVPSLIARGDVRGARNAAATLKEMFGREHIALECWDHNLPEEREMSKQLVALAHSLDMRWTVTNNVHYVHRGQRIIHDVLSSIRHRKTLDEMGTHLRPNGEWYLKRAAEMMEHWGHAPEGIADTVRIAEQCSFRLTTMRVPLPPFPLPAGRTMDEHLADLAETGAQERWGPSGTERRTARHDEQIARELALIKKLDYAGYFLAVWDIMRFARREGILAQGRGSAANSAVCYCIGITAVDPIKHNLLFARFLNEERRDEPPDIDVDFAHRERERVIQYVYEKYGREHAAMVCEQITYRGRSAVRDAARVLGFSVDQANMLSMLSDRFSARATADALQTGTNADKAVADALGSHMVPGTEANTRNRAEKEKRKQVRHPLTSSDRPTPQAAYEPYGSPSARSIRSATPAPWRDPYHSDDHVERRNPVTAVRPSDGTTVIERAGLDPKDERVATLARIVEGLHRIPRHRSIHVGGFVLTAEPLCTVVPIEPASMPGRTVIQWEKDDLDPVRLFKIDLLGLGMLTLLQDCFLYIRQTRGISLDLDTIRQDDTDVYDSLCRADTIGLFQVESRAQMNTLPRLRPRCFYDLVIEVAIIRPGPIQGDMVHPFLRRKNNEEEVKYLHPSLEPILARTLGVPLFQEQGMQVAIELASFTPGEADDLRKAMGHKRSRERMATLRQRMLDGMAAKGVPLADAEKIFNQINGFADYGFPESHAASFALLVYASAFLKYHYAPEFTAAILNAQPMGFYAAGTLIEDARRHHVVVLPVDLTRSSWDATLEEKTPGHAPAVRLGLRSIRGLGTKACDKLEAALQHGPFTSVEDVIERTKLDKRALRHLAEAGAFDSMLPHEPDLRKRRAALWSVLDAARGDAGPLAPRQRMNATVKRAPMPAMTPAEITEADYRMTGISLAGHPMSHVRKILALNGVRDARDLNTNGKDGETVAMAGLVICRQRPGTAKGFVFLTLEDETGLVNIIITPQRFEEQAFLISRTPLLLVRGVLQVEKTVVNIKARQFKALQAAVGAEFAHRHDFH